MSKVIWKYEIHIQRRCKIELPEDFVILHIGTQNDRIYIWALVNPSNSLVERTFGIIGTGHEITEEDGWYIATVQIGPYVWHVFAFESLGG